MQLDYLKYLIAIKEYGSMNKAAEHLYMSQQNISKAVKRLEEEFGYKIFTGSARKQVFTEEGERLYQYALQYETQRNVLLERLTEKSLKNINGTVRIGAMSTTSAMVLPQILASYYKDYPNITLQIVDGMITELKDMLTKQEIDMAIVIVAQIHWNDCEEFAPEIQKDVLIEGNNCCWVSRKNPLSRQKEITIEQMVQYPAVVNARSDLAMMKNIYAAYGGKLKIAMENENPYVLSKFTADDFGLFPDVAIFADNWMMKYAFGNQKDVVAVPVSKESGYGSRLYLLTNRQQHKTVLMNHVMSYILGNKWKSGGHYEDGNFAGLN